MLTIKGNSRLTSLEYGIRGRLERRANEMSALGCEIIPLHIGDPAMFDLRTPESMRLGLIENLEASEAYGPQKGLLSAREAVVAHQRMQGVEGVSAETVFMGNGVSELIDMMLRTLISDQDEVLVPTPDHPSWTAAVNLSGGRVVHYRCAAENGFEPNPKDVSALITDRTRAIVVINPNNPTGAVYSLATLQAIARIADQNELILLCDEVYGQITYSNAQFIPLAALARETLCATFSGLSKAYRAGGFRVGWVSFSGQVESASEYLAALDTLSSLRLCSSVPGQWAVKPALEGNQCACDLTRPGGRLFQSRQTILECVANSKYLHARAPMGGIYVFIGVDSEVLPQFDDRRFASDLLHQKCVLVIPGTTFSTNYNTHFRITSLPAPEILSRAFDRIEDLLDSYSSDASRDARMTSL